jgi:hypothetical protein
MNISLLIEIVQSCRYEAEIIGELVEIVTLVRSMDILGAEKKRSLE